MVRKTGITGDPWHVCARCSNDVRISSLVLQKGSWLCPKCVDNLSYENRISEINRVLMDGKTEPGDPWEAKRLVSEVQDV